MGYKDTCFSWQLFKKKVSFLKRRVKNEQIAQNFLDDFIDALKKKLIQDGVNVLHFYDLVQEKYSLTHYPISSATEQENVIYYLHSYLFSSKLAYHVLVENVIQSLNGTS